jgi:hypothetical protein
LALQSIPSPRLLDLIKQKSYTTSKSKDKNVFKEKKEDQTRTSLYSKPMTQ